MKNISVVILAGGNSSRMKRSKAFLKFDDKTTFLEKIINEYLAADIDKIILVINNSSLNPKNELILSKLSKKIILLFNKTPEKGRIYSLKLGLSKLKQTDHSFIQNIDNPFVNAITLKNLIPLIINKSWVSPTYNGKGGHPVLISKSICKYILENHDNTSVSLRNILSKFKKITIPSHRSVLININTLEDYNKYFFEKSLK